MMVDTQKSVGNIGRQICILRHLIGPPFLECGQSWQSYYAEIYIIPSRRKGKTDISDLQKGKDFPT